MYLISSFEKKLFSDFEGSIKIISGGKNFPYLSFNSTKENLLLIELLYVSKLGVAEPNKQLIFKNFDKNIAQSLALYLGIGSNCLYEFSCSSSTIIKLKFL